MVHIDFKIDLEVFIRTASNGCPETIFGKTYLYKDRLAISGGDNKYKLLHRLVYEYFNGQIEADMVIHHINFDSLDNRVENLLKLSKSDHNKIHKTNIKKGLDETLKNKISNSLNKRNNINLPLFVSIQYNKTYKNGFTFYYNFKDHKKSRIQINRTNLNKLELEVRNRDLPWIETENKTRDDLLKELKQWWNENDK